MLARDTAPRNQGQRGLVAGCVTLVLGLVVLTVALLGLQIALVLLDRSEISEERAAQVAAGRTATALARAAGDEAARAARTATAVARDAQSTATVEARVARDQRLTEQFREDARLNFASPPPVQTSWWRFIEDLRVEGDRAIVVVALERDGEALERQQLVNLCSALSWLVSLTMGPDAGPDHVPRLLVVSTADIPVIVRQAPTDRCDPRV
ncbi:MAG: hypothetical protein KatS3mg060_1182 [Dehalococcoidia bacterium]|nr:MAG: hypothetical protein KatS3mg060_1182 [Dehalococcoidia bacterium]